MNLSVQMTMKSAANCDKHCELQNSEKHQILERALHSWDTPESNPASVSFGFCPYTISMCSGVGLDERAHVHGRMDMDSIHLEVTLHWVFFYSLALSVTVCGDPSSWSCLSGK